MSAANRENAVAAFGPLLPMIRKIVDDAWDECRTVDALRRAAGLAPIYYDRTKSNDVFDAIARRAIMRLGALEGVLLEIEAQTFKFVVKGIVARFKKGGDDKLGRNIRTQSALAFMEADGVLPGMPAPAGKVEFVWLPNELWTKIDRVLMIARDGDNLLWEHEIEGQAGSLVELPVTPQTLPDGDDLIKPKSTPSKKTDEQ